MASRHPLRTVAAEAPRELAENPFVKYWRTMSPQQEDVAEHLLDRDLREHDAEIERLRAEESAA